MKKQYYWADDLKEYNSDNDTNYMQNEIEQLDIDSQPLKVNPVIEIKRLNFLIGKNNAGKSRFLRNIFKSQISIVRESTLDFHILDSRGYEFTFFWLTQERVNKNRQSIKELIDKAKVQKLEQDDFFNYEGSESLISNSDISNSLEINEFYPTYRKLIDELYEDTIETIRLCREIDPLELFNEDLSEVFNYLMKKRRF